MDSYDHAPTVEERLVKMGLDFVACDSGGKGAHFGVLRDNPPSHLLPAQDKRWVRENFEGLADLTLYTHLHLFRIEGSVHELTGRRKEQLYRQSGKALVLPRYERAERPEVLTTLASEKATSIFKCLRVMSYTRPAPVGERHTTLLTLAHALRDDAEVSEDVAIFWLREANKLFDEPRSEEDLEKIVSWVYGPGRASA